MTLAPTDPVRQGEPAGPPLPETCRRKGTEGRGPRAD